MKLIEITNYHNDIIIDQYDTLGIQWLNCEDFPFRSNYPDKTYYHYIVVYLCMKQNRISITIRLNKMPYRNYKEYLIYRKAKRNQVLKNIK